jgi:Ca-activated chloride channel family protein
MSFAWPLALVALVAVPIVLALYVRHDRSRGRTIARFGNPALFPNLVPAWPGRRRHVPVVLLLLALTVLLVGMARPRATVSATRNEATVVLAVDVSYSMAAQDVRPTRLAAAQAAARTFLEKVPKSLNVGLVEFGTRAHPVVFPTTDRERLLAGIDSLHPGEGTALGDGVRVSLIAAGARRPGTNHPPLAILLLSDGAQTVGKVTPAAAARLASERGVPVYTVALGTPDGIVERPLAGGYKERIAVPPDPRTLQALASTTGGQFFTAPTASQLSVVYTRLAKRLGHRAVRREVTAAFAGAGALLFLAGGALSTLWFRRPV